MVVVAADEYERLRKLQHLKAPSFADLLLAMPADGEELERLEARMRIPGSDVSTGIAARRTAGENVRTIASAAAKPPDERGMIGRLQLSNTIEVEQPAPPHCPIPFIQHSLFPTIPHSHSMPVVLRQQQRTP